MNSLTNQESHVSNHKNIARAITTVREDEQHISIKLECEDSEQAGEYDINLHVMSNGQREATEAVSEKNGRNNP